MGWESAALERKSNASRKQPLQAALITELNAPFCLTPAHLTYRTRVERAFYRNAPCTGLARAPSCRKAWAWRAIRLTTPTPATRRRSARLWRTRTCGACLAAPRLHVQHRQATAHEAHTSYGAHTQCSLLQTHTRLLRSDPTWMRSLPLFVSAVSSGTQPLASLPWLGRYSNMVTKTKRFSDSSEGRESECPNRAVAAYR